MNKIYKIMFILCSLFTMALGLYSYNQLYSDITYSVIVIMSLLTMLSLLVMFNNEKFDPKEFDFAIPLLYMVFMLIMFSAIYIFNELVIFPYEYELYIPYYFNIIFVGNIFLNVYTIVASAKKGLFFKKEESVVKTPKSKKIKKTK